MAGSGKVDILIIREAAGVRRFRASTVLLRLIWLVPLLLLVFLAGVVAVAYHLRQDNLVLAGRNAGLRKELDGAGERLIKLENIEKVLRSRDVTELETLIGSYNTDNPGWWKPGVASGAKGQAAKERDTRPDISRLLAKVDLNQAEIANLRVKIDKGKLHLNFDLSNATPQTNLVGRVEVALVSPETGLLPLKSDNDLAFQIQRFKQIATSFSLPGKYEAKDISGLRVAVIDPAGKTVFAQVYPLPKD